MSAVPRRLPPIALACALLLAAHGARAGGAAPPTPIDIAPADWPEAALGKPRDVAVLVRAHVAPDGTVSDAAVVRPTPPFDAAAIEAARWSVFHPAHDAAGRPVAAIADVSVPFRAADAADADPLNPDVIALALAAERGGDLRSAIDAWTGALGRVGQHPRLRDPWPIRARIVRLAARMPQWPAIPNVAIVPGLNAHERQLRDLSRAGNESYAAIYASSLAIGPWWRDGWRWQAAALAASGRHADAVRATLLWRLAVPDSAARARAARALAALAADDTLGAYTLLKE